MKIMTSSRLLVQLGTSCLIMGACAAENPNASGQAGASSGGGSGSTTAGVTGASGVTGTSGVTSSAGTSGTTASGGTVGAGGQAGTGSAAGSGGMGGAIAGAAGMGAGGAAGTDGGGYPLKNPPVPSAGCGKAATFTSSKYPEYRQIMSSGDKRNYVIDLPPNYDMNKPYRFIMGSHGQGGEGNDIQREKYYGLQNIADVASSTIFVSASGLGGIWGLKDVPLFDDILAFVKQNACVDESRVFVLGFSFGGMYSYSLSMTRQKTIRAGIGMSPANYNIQIPTKGHEPIAWMQSTGMGDGTCPWVSNEAQKRGAKFIAIEHAIDNGCTVPDPIPTWKSGNMLCDELAACKPGYPIKVCTFNGGHSPPPGYANWMWEFISQF
jgi:poly(3-hydroxybutyrate) depolymerase